MYGIFGREITIRTVICGADIRGLANPMLLYSKASFLYVAGLANSMLVATLTLWPYYVVGP